MFDRPHIQDKLTVWIGFCGDNTIFGPIFFDNNVNGLVYLDMINKWYCPWAASEVRHTQEWCHTKKVGWVQDGAPAHRRILVRDRLQKLFPNFVCGLDHNQVYPPRSTDLTPLDFYLWGYLKMKVFETPPANLQDLRNRNVWEVQALTRIWQVIAAFQDMREIARKCVVLGGSQMEGCAGQ